MMIGPACQFQPAAPPLEHTTKDASPISGVIPSLDESQYTCTVPQIVDAGSSMVRKSRFANVGSPEEKIYRVTSA